MSRRILIFHNAFSAKGKSSRGLRHLEEALTAKNIAYKVLQTLQDVQTNTTLLTAANREFSPTEIWSSGGDGTLHLLVNALPADMWHLPVAVLPTGSGNDFVKNFLTRPTLQKCLEAALSGSLQPVDVWDCNGRLFIHGLGIGFDGQVVESMSKKGSFLSGHLAYYYHVLRLLLGYREKEVIITHDGQTKKMQGFMITLGNSTTFGGGFKITPQAGITDGLLDVCAISKVPVLKRPFYMKKLEHGNHLSLSIVNYFKTREITLETAQPVPGHIDGELFYAQRFLVKPFEMKLRVIMPQAG